MVFDKKMRFVACLGEVFFRESSVSRPQNLAGRASEGREYLLTIDALMVGL